MYFVCKSRSVIAIIEHLFIYGSGRTLMSQLWSVEAVNIIINIMPDKFTKFNAFQRSCHLSFKNLVKQMYLYFFTTIHLKSQFICQCLLHSRDILPFTAVFFVIFIA